MQIILMERVANLGNLGDVVKVKEGYARNYLIPQGKAKRATPDNLKLLEARRAELEKAEAERLGAAKALAEKLNALTLKIGANAGIDGRLFGSVTNADIADGLKAMGFEVEKAAVRMPEGPLKHIGEFPITLALHTDVTADITVAVHAE